MTKRQLIDAIRRHNPTATPEFLEQFDEPALAQYLQHLEAALAGRKEISGWSRPRPRYRMVG